MKLMTSLRQHPYNQTTNVHIQFVVNNYRNAPTERGINYVTGTTKVLGCLVMTDPKITSMLWWCTDKVLTLCYLWISLTFPGRCLSVSLIAYVVLNYAFYVDKNNNNYVSPACQTIYGAEKNKLPCVYINRHFHKLHVLSLIDSS